MPLNPLFRPKTVADETAELLSELVEKEILELKRIRGICCPEPTCDYKRETYTTCEGCGASCTVCIHNPTNRNKQSGET